MCVWFPHWPLQETIARNPDWKQHPVVLYANGGRSGWTVVLRSRRAAEHGVAPGITLAQARVLLDAPDLSPKFEQFDWWVHREALDKLAVDAMQFSPIVGVEDADVPECLLLDITGCDHLFGGERAMAERVAAVFTERGYVVRVAVADAIGAAWAVSHHADDVNVTPPGKQEHILRPLPIEGLRLETKALVRFHQLDVRTIAQLQLLPRQSLPSRFGVNVVHRLDQALGRAPELIKPVVPAYQATAEKSLPYPVRNRRIVETILEQLLEQVVAKVENKNHGIQQLVCRFIEDRKTQVRVTVRVLCPTLSVKQLLELIHLQLDATKLPSEVWQMRIEAKVVASLEVRQLTLFDDVRDYEKQQALSSLIERLSHRLGASAIVRPQWSFDPQPEYAVGYQSALDAKPDETPAPATSRFRPVQLLPEPASVEVMSVVPDGPPIRFAWRGKRYDVAQCWGPERIETGWWRDTHTRRDYYRVETHDGRRFWLYRDMADGRWFLQGCF